MADCMAKNVRSCEIENIVVNIEIKMCKMEDKIVCGLFNGGCYWILRDKHDM